MTPPVPEVIVGHPVRQLIVEWDEYVGRLEAVEFVEVRALVSGYLDSTHFDEGQIVNAGDLLAVIDPRPFVAEVNRAEADVAQSNARIAQQEAAIVKAEAEHRSAQVGHDLALKTVERWRSLFQRNIATQEDLDTREADYAQTRANVDAAAAATLAAKADLLTARAAVETANANLELARLNLSYTEVRAPVKGRVSSRSVTEGNLISGGTAQSTLLTTIVSLDPIHCTFDADEAAYLKYVKLAREGKRQSSRDVRQPVYVALANEPDGFPHHGYMDFVENRIDQETDTIRGRAILPNSNMALTPGLFARVRIPGSARYEAILIPDLAIGTDQADKFVFTVDGKSTVHRRVIKLGPLVHGLRVVRDGLDGSELIVLRGLQWVRPGSPIRPKEEAIQTVDDGLPDDYQPVPEELWLRPRKQNGVSPKPPNLPVSRSTPSSVRAPAVQPADATSPQQKQEGHE